ncbi:MAG: hypothetical protein K0Q90_886 [Paenibacillaceae bacterium]|nr:hypothetical protein [Paenibacillaceae bacterium]
MNTHKDRAILSLDTALEEQFRRRSRLLLEKLPELEVPDWDRSRRHVFLAIGRLGLGTDTEWALESLAQVCKDPGGESMFVRHGLADCLYRFGGQMGEPLTGSIRAYLTAKDHYRMEGGTENHKIMHAAAGILAAQRWPDWSLSAEIKERCNAYLEHYFNRVVRYGQGEFDSTTYSVFYLTALASLFDFAEDPRLAKQAGMMMDWYLANTAGDWLNGRFTGAHSRDYHPTNEHGAAEGGIASSWLYFGGRTPDLTLGEPHYSSILALSGYRVPDALAAAARERELAFLHRETHDTAAPDETAHDGHSTLQSEKGCSKGYGYISRRGVRKTSWVTPGYTLGSMWDGKQGDIVWSGQMRRWSLMWDAEAHRSAFFFTHPFPDFGHETEDYVGKWLGSSPYEQVLQHRGALVALYCIPHGETYKYGPRQPFPSDRDPYIDGFLDPTALIYSEERDGWLFAHGGTVMFAFKTLKPWIWTEEAGEKRLRCQGLRNAVFVMTAEPDRTLAGNLREAPGSAQAHLELADFRKRILEETDIQADLAADRPEVALTVPGGDKLYIQYDGARQVNGEDVDYEGWPLLDNRHLYSGVGSGIMECKAGSGGIRWDYNTWEISVPGAVLKGAES